MNRRGFIKSLSTAAAVLWAKPSIALEIIRERSIAIPVGRYIHADMIARETLVILQNSLQAARYYDDDFMPARSCRVGDTVRVRMPARYEVRR